MDRTTPNSPQSGARRLLLCVGCAAIITGLILHFSFRHGRLSSFLRLDDIGYISDGMLRLSHFEHEGWRGFWNDYRNRPPHSPYSDLLAMTALGVLGKHDWAPYAANGLLALAFVIAADRMLPRLKLCQKLCCFVFLATVPLIGMAIHEFLPDFATSLLTACGILLLVARPFAFSSAWHKLSAGAMFGLALLAKPPVFPATLAFFLASMVLATLCDLYARRRPITFAKVARGWLLCLLPAVLIPLPHYLMNGRQIVHYIFDAQIGLHAKVWAKQGTLAFHIRYYVDGDSGKTMLGRDAWVLIGLLLLGAFEVLRWRQFRVALVGTALTIVLILAWLVPTLNPHKQRYLGLTFQVLLLLLGLREVNRITAGNPESKTPPRMWRKAIPFLVAGLGLLFFQWPTWPRYALRERTQRRAVVDGIYHEIADRSRGKGTRPLVILNSAGAINASLYQYYALRDSLPLDVYTPDDTGDPDAYTRWFDQATFIVAAERDTQFFADFLLSDKIQPKLLADVRARGDFVEIKSFTNPRTGASLHLFQRTAGAR